MEAELAGLQWRSIALLEGFEVIEDGPNLRSNECNIDFVKRSILEVMHEM